jgi:hypothetical protein
MTAADRTKLCPECVKYVPDTDSTCRHCGYAFDGGTPATAEWTVGVTQSGVDQYADVATAGGTPRQPDVVHWQGSSVQTSGMQPTAAKSGNKLGCLIAIVVIIASIGIPLFQVARGVGDAVDDFEVPDIVIPPFTPPPPIEVEVGTFATCRAAGMRWMREMLANDGQGSRSLSELFIEASEEVGPTSPDYQVIIQAFSGAQGVAFQEGTRAGIRAARPIVVQGCREAYP